MKIPRFIKDRSCFRWVKAIRRAEYLVNNLNWDIFPSPPKDDFLSNFSSKAKITEDWTWELPLT